MLKIVNVKNQVNYVTVVVMKRRQMVNVLIKKRTYENESPRVQRTYSQKKEINDSCNSIKN